MSSESKKFTLASTEKLESRQRELQYLINIVEPDPEYQPMFVSDEASVLDLFAHDESLIKARLEAHFKIDCGFVFSLPVWNAIDELKVRVKGWPDELEIRSH